MAAEKAAAEEREAAATPELYQKGSNIFRMVSDSIEVQLIGHARNNM